MFLFEIRLTNHFSMNCFIIQTYFNTVLDRLQLE
uniref:Uncharacterized protein n=1 Tax=Siphoviridae sp. ctPsO101 TaxID=2825487 RepID=A0A8S5PW54_9CAUD|nr:MAG TPA: hypothetical protein [Siphoviridae sp. ctPsO101]